MPASAWRGRLEHGRRATAITKASSRKGPNAIKAPKCDACGCRIRPSHHELRLSDATTGQTIGRYHVTCQAAATKYFEPGVVLSATYCHPSRCGPHQERCDGGVFEVVA